MIKVFKKSFLEIMPLFVFILLFHWKIAVSAQTNDEKSIWNIGVADGSASEFALSPNGFKNFVPEGFGGANRYYVVGESAVDKDFPYLLPGPKDEFAGYGYWAGLALNTLPIYFEVAELPKTGKYTLKIDILGVNAQQAPLFRATVNGKTFQKQLRKGQSKLPTDIKNDQQTIAFDIPHSVLKKGINEIKFQNMTGNWFIFDAVALLGPNALQINTPGKTFLLNVAFSDKELDQKSEPNSLPLLVEMRHKGKKVDVKAVIGEEAITLSMEEGHSILEFRFPSVDRKTTSKVEVFVGDKLKYSDNLVRAPRPKQMLSDYVDQFMGTSGSRWMIAPGPWMPMGMAKIAPENEDSRWKAGYDYQIENIMGFSHIHEWTMAGLLMMPTNGDLKIQPGTENNPALGYRSRIDKKSEKAEVGKYTVDLLDYDIRAELTATTRAVMQRYTLPKEKENRVLIDLHFPSEYTWELRDATINKTNDTEIIGSAVSHCSSTGYRGEQDYTLHFVIQFDTPIKNMGGWVMDRIVEDIDKIDRTTYEPSWHNHLKNFKIGDAGAFVSFQKGTEQIKIRTGISLVSIEQARLNLNEEMVRPFNWDFEGIVANQKHSWNELLGKVIIETPDYQQKVKFYTNMYRALSPRTTWSDVNGKWVDMNEKVQRTDPSKPIFGSDGYWGWHWNLVQFYNLIIPEYSFNWINSYLEMYDKGGWLTRGNPGMEYFAVMPGQPEIPLIVSAYQHGIRDFDTEKMFKALVHQQTAPMNNNHPGGGRVGNESYNFYLDLGYVPLNEESQSYVSNTMEYSYQDWCVAQYAKALLKEDAHNLFMKRSENWRNIFDIETGFVRPKYENGTWYKDFSPFYSPGFCESNSWQYSWYVPQNMPGLVSLMGRKKFVEKLNKGMKSSEKVYFNALADDFSKYPINHGNESNMQSSYLFNYAGEPWLTQKWTRAIQEKYYGSGPRDAYPGDEDQGQMSAWYVMSTLGLFQMDGGASVNPQYELGSPRFEKATIHLSDRYYGGKTFVIEAKNASRENKYIKSATLNGQRLGTWKFPQKELVKGGQLILEMSDTPNKKWK